MIHRLLALCALALVACVTEEGIQERWDAWVDDHDACEVADDCGLVYPGCPLGCYDTVHVDFVEEAEAEADRLITRWERGGRACDYGCMEAPDPVCSDAGECELPEE